MPIAAHSLAQPLYAPNTERHSSRYPPVSGSCGLSQQFCEPVDLVDLLDAGTDDDLVHADRLTRLEHLPDGRNRGRDVVQ